MKGCYDCNLGGRHKRTNCAGGVPVNRSTHFSQTMQSCTWLHWANLLEYYKLLLELQSRFKVGIIKWYWLGQEPGDRCHLFLLNRHHWEQRCTEKRSVYVWLWVGVIGQTSSSWENSSLVQRTLSVNGDNDNKGWTNIYTTHHVMCVCAHVSLHLKAKLVCQCGALVTPSLHFIKQSKPIKPI